MSSYGYTNPFTVCFTAMKMRYADYDSSIEKLNFVNQNDKCLIEDSEGNIYSEDDINWRYQLSLGACLIVWLDKFGYKDIREAFKEGTEKYEAQLKDLFELLIKQGYINKK